MESSERMEKKFLFPGDTIGIIGESSNGIMLAEAAKKMGFKVIAYNSDEAAPTVQEADLGVVGSLHSKSKLQDFAERCDLVTYESDKVPSDAVELVKQYTQVPQGSEALEITQDRLLERAFLEQMNVNIAPYATIVSLDDIYQAIGSIGYPCVLKPIQKGFGRKRQQVINKQSDIAKCADIIDLGTYVLEAWIPYEKELSVIIGKEFDGKLNFFPIVENVYRDHHLFQSITKSQLEADVQSEVHRIATEIATQLDYVGVLEIAFFLTNSGSLYVKRVVPALHKAGFVFEKATNISMFEVHLRALAQMPIPQVRFVQPTVMVAIKDEDLEPLRTQWVLKDNWFYRFYRYPQTKRMVNPGYLLVLAGTTTEAVQQIEATNIWGDKSAESDASKKITDEEIQ
ncbi:ATP-grasp domain-containing protein [Liquorilactobacillus mali]|uniref:Phosphoribosylaminoimidazole carboxylase, ATPase subunit n=2 Tax=Liquorilactobacillus mali TaxID=1618 RepID=J1F460_9LACO|nr:phosphoribosylaminoimidazole carboxylase NCAIR mutase subunit [Liquorilactobacillus mali KCTC 3596 = DSM 20444]KRN09703.1 phosphoribosylaminoimidazole carboxylase, ATPase subunit [Liquorilactobacillus mali KCTC 3596 = DSM 20444]QFQ73994.1 ATP-grasp domain-containing protein [Liquorilactobacillus mali]